MPALVVPNAGVLRLIWSFSGQLYALNVMGVVNSSNVAITQALTNTIGAAVKSGLTSSGHAALLNTSIALVSVGLRDIRSANTAEFIDSGGVVSGANAADPLPLQIANVVTLRTAFAGRSFRGRVYLCGYTEANNTPGGVLSSVTAGVAFITAIKAALVASSLDLGVLSRPAPQLPVPRAGFITPVTSIVSRDAVWDTQRRRAVPGI